MDVFVALTREYGLPIATFVAVAVVLSRVVIVLWRENTRLYREIIDDQRAEIDDLKARLYQALGTAEPLAQAVERATRERRGAR